MVLGPGKEFALIVPLGVTVAASRLVRAGHRAGARRCAEELSRKKDNPVGIVIKR
jgi:hypothetical protein